MKAIIRTIVIFFAGLIFGYCSLVQADPLVIDEQKVTAGDKADDDQFGNSVAISGDTALVGAYWADYDPDSSVAGDEIINSGAAYILNRHQDGSWVLDGAKLTAGDDRAEDDWFGLSVALHGDTALVGVHHDDDMGADSGSVYVFTRDSSGFWSQQQKLTASDGEAYDYFGFSLALSGDTALVGAFSDDIDNNYDDKGSVYVFTRDCESCDWIQQQKLLASDRADDDYFGYSLALSGDTALVGAYNDDDNGTNSGSVYLFTRDSHGDWNQNQNQNQKWHAGDGARNDEFGRSIALWGDTALVGAPKDKNNGKSTGSAYVFTRGSGGSWSQEEKLLASDRAEGDAFGRSVAVWRDTTLVGAYKDDDDQLGNDSGSAYVFSRDSHGWTQREPKLTELFNNEPAANDWFGFSLALSADTALVGAYKDDNIKTDAGAAYIFAFPCSFGQELIVDQWMLIGAPCDPDDPANPSGPVNPDLPGNALVNVYGDDLDPQDYLNEWIMYENVAADDSYKYLRSSSTISPGAAHWIKTLKANTFIDGPTLDVEGKLTDTAFATVPGSECETIGQPCFVMPLSVPSDSGSVKWNMLAHPFAYPVDWSDVRILVSDNNVQPYVYTAYTPSAADTAGYVSKTYQVYNGNTYVVFDDGGPADGTLQPGRGFWIEVKGNAWDKVIKLVIPAKPSIKTTQLEFETESPWYAVVLKWLFPAAQAAEQDWNGGQNAAHALLKGYQKWDFSTEVETVDTQSKLPVPSDITSKIKGYQQQKDKNQAQKKRIRTGIDWYIRLTVEVPEEHLKDSGNLLGQLTGSLMDYDARDLEELPPFGTPYLTLVFPHDDWGAHAGSYATDFHPSTGNKKGSWDFEIRSDETGREVNLCWQGPVEILEKATLMDLDRNEKFKLKNADLNGCLSVSMDEQIRHFRWMTKQ